ncbi:MAG: phosphotransferase [Chloroflexota bacterium]
MQDRDIDLVFVDPDYDSLSEITMFITQLREMRPKLPIVVFTSSADDKMRYLLREGASWHFNKHARAITNLAEQVQQYVFSPVNWEEIFAQYASETVKPRIEPGLSYADLETLNKNPEERYIIKRLFANSDIVQIFRMDEGFSGSRIYTVKPAHQLKRILKIEVADKLEAVQEKQEHLIQPRLNRRVGQIQGKMVRGQHYAGACYTLAGSNQDTITLTQFLQDQNKVRKELIDKILDQLRQSLDRLYEGSSDTELRYWAPLYSRVLPTHLTLEDANLVEAECDDADFILDAAELTTLSSVPGNRTLRWINTAVRAGAQPIVILRDFEVAELDTEQGVLYVHDNLVAQYPLSPLLKGKNHPILRFKIRLDSDNHQLLSHPLFRRGKRISIRGRVCETQESILGRTIMEVTGESFNYESNTFEFASSRFISPLTNVRYLLWEIGREDMIIPIPQVSPVVHGDLNTSNILVEDDQDASVWLIDFSDARPGHIYFDLAKLEVEFRTHVFYRVFEEMVEEGFWDVETAVKFLLLIENMLLDTSVDKFEAFVAAVRDQHPDWYDTLYTQFPLYFENLLYFLYSLRRMAETYSPERFKYHYPVAVFFQSIAALKYQDLADQVSWYSWAKRMALCCALVSGKQAVESVKRPSEVSSVLDKLRQRSSFAFIAVGNGGERKYMLQWNANWGMFNLIGGKVDNEKGDRNSFARAIQRELLEELGLKSPKDYRIVRELQPVIKQQFSRRQLVFKDYEFRVFQIEIFPRHPQSQEEYDRFAPRLSPERENVLVSRVEIERLRTSDNRPISETTRMILQELGELTAVEHSDQFAQLDFRLEQSEVVVSRGRAQVTGWLSNPRFGSLVENVMVEILPSAAYVAEEASILHRVHSLEAGEETAVSLWLQPKEKEGKLAVRLTYYDVRGHEYRQIVETDVVFWSQHRSFNHVNNPYVVGKPLTQASEMLYVGREDVFRWVEENLLGKTQPHTLILYGQRRMGKTSTLYQLVGGERGKAIREYPNYPIYPVYIDLQRLASSATGEFFERFSYQIARHLGQRGIEVEPPETWSANGRSYHIFDGFLDRVEEALPSNGLLVLIVDELEQLQASVERGHLNKHIFPYLRSLMQHRPKLTFILAGTTRLMEDYWSEIFHVGISREITSLSRNETETLIREPVAPMIHYEDVAVDQIWLATQGHTYFTQLICHRLVSTANLDGRGNKVITMNDVRDTIDCVIEEYDSHLLHIWNEVSPEEQFVLAALAGTREVGDENLSRPEIFSRLNKADIDEDGITEALKLLEHRRLVSHQAVERQIQTRIPRPGGWEPMLVSKDYMYSVGFDLLRRWVARKRPLGSLIY